MVGKSYNLYDDYVRLNFSRNVESISKEDLIELIVDDYIDKIADTMLDNEYFTTALILMFESYEDDKINSINKGRRTGRY